MRETERSRRASLRSRSRISLRREVGWMNSGCASMCASSCAWYLGVRGGARVRVVPGGQGWG